MICCQELPKTLNGALTSPDFLLMKRFYLIKAYDVCKGNGNIIIVGFELARFQSCKSKTKTFPFPFIFSINHTRDKKNDTIH